MTQKYQVKVSMKQAAIVETGIVLKQGDFGMQIEIEVLDFDATGTTPQIVFRKAMGAVESTTITVSSNKYTYTFKGTELDTPGKVFCDLKLKNSTTQRISTASFMFKVVADTLDGLAEESSSYSDTLEQILGTVPTAMDAPAGYNDFDQFKTMGVYTILAANTYGHDPIGAGKKRTLIVLAKADTTCNGQVIFDRESGDLYFRSLAQGTTWSNWKYVAQSTFAGIQSNITSIESDVDDLEAALTVSSIIQPGEEIDLNDYTTECRIQMRAGVIPSHSPLTNVSEANASELQVIGMNNGAAVMQIYTDFVDQNQFRRYYTSNSQTFTDWQQTAFGMMYIVSGAVDFNDYTTTGKIYIPRAQYPNCSHIPTENVKSGCILTTDKVASGVVFQRANLFNAYREFMRIRNASNQWTDWMTIGGSVIYTSGTYNLDNMKTEGKFVFRASCTLSPQPETAAMGPYILTVKTVNTDQAVYQYLIDVRTGANFERYFTSSSWGDWYSTTTDLADNIQSVDFNNIISPGTYYITRANANAATNAPTNSADSNAVLKVVKEYAGLIFQDVTYYQSDLSYRRFRNYSNVWSDWRLKSGIALYGEIIRTASVDLNDYVAAGNYTFGSQVSFTNGPANAMTSVFDLKVFDYSPANVLMQQLIDPRNNHLWYRYRAGDGAWWGWVEVGTASAPGILFDSPTLSKISFTRSRMKKNAQDIAVYGGHIFDFGEGVVSIDGAANISISNGHGNNAMFGKTLHGDYPYLYCGSWDYDDCKIYINQVGSGTMTLVNTLTFSLSGHLNMCVDEDNSRIYIFLNKSESTAVGDIDFIVADLSDGSIISTKTLDFAIPKLQGMEFFNGKIYVLNGNTDSNVTNHLTIFDTTGNVLQKSEPIPIIESEGISFDNGIMYFADTNNIWY